MLKALRALAGIVSLLRSVFGWFTAQQTRTSTEEAYGDALKAEAGKQGAAAGKVAQEIESHGDIGEDDPNRRD